MRFTYKQIKRFRYSIFIEPFPNPLLLNRLPSPSFPFPSLFFFFLSLLFHPHCFFLLMALLYGGIATVALGYTAYRRWYAYGPLFGVSLQEGDIPLPLLNCFEYFENNEKARQSHGIFRLSGKASRVKELQVQYDNRQVVNLEEEDPSTVCSLLKHFFKLLPEPLIPYSFYPRFLELATEQDEQKWLEGAKKLFEEMPKMNVVVCARLFSLLHSIGKEEEHNQMGHGNLAKVIFPVVWLESPGEMTAESLKHLPHLERTALRCIVLCEEVFEGVGERK